jgi:(1->4)-alpha-D-glucan 1-alpha-D-glucosylmutase
MNENVRRTGHVPRATYRLQFTPDFRFAQATELVPYLHQLGISDIYCSPILTARPGSLHGYDVTDPLHINPQLGGREEFERLSLEARRHDINLLMDIVPNHMAASIDNPWWYDVLLNGPSSRFAHFFDIEWDPADPNESLHNRVLLPILGARYGETLESGEIRLEAAEDGYNLRYFEHRLPVALESYALIFEDGDGALREHLHDTSGDWSDVQRLLDEIAELPPRNHFEQHVANRRRRIRSEFAATLSRLRALPDGVQALERRLTEVNGVPGEPRSFDRLDRIIRRQAYRLAFWQIAREQINYRRFFDVNEFVSLRVEDDDVFETTHQLVLELVAAGVVSGLRIDHIDGLRDPGHYLRTLRKRLDSVKRTGAPSAYLVVEKILASDEPLPQDWPVSGTTGYETLNLIGDLFVDPVRLPAIEENYRRVCGVTGSYTEIVYLAKRQLLETTFSAYVRSLSFALEAVSNSDRHGRDLTFDSLQKALIETTAALPVYRTYVSDLDVHDRDRGWIEQAIETARARRPDLRQTLDFLAGVLTLDIPGYVPSARHGEWLDVVMRWQQLSGPVMAKGNEDTALYRFFPLASRNEVGGQPEQAPTSIDETHDRLHVMAQRWPHSMIATSTHDTKRSEDVRARINVLSELPNEWSERFAAWQRFNRDQREIRNGRVIPNDNLEYFIYQTLIGAWPLDQNEVDQFRRRLHEYVIKAVREAKEHSSWGEPDAVYEDALMSFLDSLFNSDRSGAFLADFTAFQGYVARVGALNSLSQTLIKLTSPGVPDIYQGSELWDLSLVDPDNRRPVDYQRRQQELAGFDRAASRGELLDELMANWSDGRINLFQIK